MLAQRFLTDFEQRYGQLLVRVGKGVDADDLAPAFVELALEAVGRVGDLLLRVARLYGGNHAAVSVDLVDVAPNLPLDLVGQRLDEPRSAQRVDRVGHTCLGGDDLLLPEGEQSGVRRW